MAFEDRVKNYLQKCELLDICQESCSISGYEIAVVASLLE